MSGDEDYSTSTPRKWLGSYDTISTNVGGTQTKTHADRIVLWTDTALKGRNPNWKLDIALNRNATTNLTGYAVQCGATYGYCKAQKKVTPASGTYMKEVAGNWFTPVIYSDAVLASISSAEATNLAKQKFLKKLIKAEQALESMVSLGESRETLRMLRGGAIRLWKGIKNWHTLAKRLRPRNRQADWQNFDNFAYQYTFPYPFPSSRKKRKPPKSSGPKRDLYYYEQGLRNAWLEQAFGWRPFISDIESAADAINRWNDYYSEKVAIKAGASTESGTVTDSEQIDGVFRFAKTERVNTLCIAVFAGSVKSIAMNPARFRAELLGFKPQNFVPTVWELIPYSFLVDYFTNIGEVINGWAHQRGRLAWARHTVIKSKTWRCNSVPRVADASYYPVLLESTMGETISKQVSRTPYTDNFMPDFEFEIPGLSMKWLNMAALAKFRR